MEKYAVAGASVAHVRTDTSLDNDALAVVYHDAFCYCEVSDGVPGGKAHSGKR